MVSTQASQLRLTQRLGDTGWIEAASTLERESSFGSEEWMPVRAYTLASVMSINSRAVSYKAVFARSANAPATPHRVYIGDNGLKVTASQRAGTMYIIKPDGATYAYPLEFTISGHLAPVMPYQQKWQFGQVGDRYQIESSFNIV